MASSGFSFSAPQSSATSGLFGAKTTQSTISFGSQPSTAFGTLGAAAKTTASSFSFGAAPAATSSSSAGGLFGAAKTSSTTGFSLSAPTNAAPAAGGLFGAIKTTASTGFSSGGLFTTSSASSTTGGGLFGKTTTPGFNLSAPTASSISNPFGGAKTTAAAIGFGTTTATSTANATTAKLPENVKEAIVPAELKKLVDDLEKHIKSQKDTKEEISKISSEGIDKTKEQLKGLKQNVALISNAVQRNSIAVENLKFDVTQELKNAEICNRIDHVSANLHHNFTAPIQYFQRLVFSFETRINNYRQEIEELEAFLTSTSPVHEFTPQDLSNILRRLSESFVGLASELHQIHEVVKDLKEKYLHYRRVMYNDTSDPFVTRKKRYKSSDKTIGPSPFPIVQGAGIMASAFKPEQKVTTAATGITIPRQVGFASTFTKPAGITRSFSFDGSATKSNIGSSLGGSGSLFGKPALGATPSLNSTGTFTLQKPPTGKRGRIL